MRKEKLKIVGFWVYHLKHKLLNISCVKFEDFVWLTKSIISLFFILFRDIAYIEVFSVYKATGKFNCKHQLLGGMQWSLNTEIPAHTVVEAAHLLIHLNVKAFIVLCELSETDSRVLVHNSSDLEHRSSRHLLWRALELNDLHLGLYTNKFWLNCKVNIYLRSAVFM